MVRKSNSQSRIIFSLLTLAAIFLSLDARALTRGLSSSTFRPTSDNGTYFGVWDGSKLNPLEWRVGTYLTYENQPFQITTAGARVQGITDNSVIQHFTTRIMAIYDCAGSRDHSIATEFSHRP